jgi:hypothetical protein
VAEGKRENDGTRDGRKAMRMNGSVDWKHRRGMNCAASPLHHYYDRPARCFDLIASRRTSI